MCLASVDFPGAVPSENSHELPFFNINIHTFDRLQFFRNLIILISPDILIYQLASLYNSHNILFG